VPQLPNLDLTDDQLRSLVIEFLAQFPESEPLQLATLKGEIGGMVAKRGLGGIPPQKGGPPSYFPPALDLPDSVFVRCCDIVWDLIIEGVLRPGDLGDSRNLPQFHVTLRGRELLKHGSMSPHDPDGYLKRLDSSVPTLDPIIRIYLVESLDTFRYGSLLSSTITLGCASEKAILNLTEAYADALPQHDGEPLKKKFKRQTIKERYDEFNKSANDKDRLKSAVPKELKDALETPVKSIFEMYRLHRNAAGHPTGNLLSREEAHAHLIIFPHYIKRLYSLIDWLKTNNVP
jgi:hypothetical protein